MNDNEHIRRRWQRPVWDERVKLMAEQVEPRSRVIDLGAGAQTLKRLLGPGGTYTPADLVRKTPDTLHFDMNRDQWPKGAWDVAVLSGVLEFADNPYQALVRVRRLAPRALLSYEAGGSLAARTGSGFANHMSRAGLEKLLTSTGWRFRIVGKYNSQVIYRLGRK